MDFLTGDNIENIFNIINKYLSDDMDEPKYDIIKSSLIKIVEKNEENLEINKTLENVEKNVVHHVFNHYLFYYKKQ